MNRKLLLITLAFSLALLATPFVGIATAGLGEEKQDFLFHLDGSTIPKSADRVIYTPGDATTTSEAKTVHIKGMEWDGVFYIEIGPSGAIETITNDYIDYDAELNFNLNRMTGGLTVVVREVISIYSSATVHDASTLRGTLELKSIGQGNSNFIGFGTDEFDRVKISGSSDYTFPNMVIDRIGTVMGWT